MKRYIRGDSWDTDSSYVPDDFTPEFADSVVAMIERAIKKKFIRKYDDIQVDADDVSFDGTHMRIGIMVFEDGIMRKSGYFEFSAYDDYFDSMDFRSHLGRTITKFVDSL